MTSPMIFPCKQGLGCSAPSASLIKDVGYSGGDYHGTWQLLTGNECVQEEGPGESAFMGPGLQRAPSAPNLMDFGADTPTPPGSAGCAAHLESSSDSFSSHSIRIKVPTSARSMPVAARTLECINEYKLTQHSMYSCPFQFIAAHAQR